MEQNEALAIYVFESGANNKHIEVLRIAADGDLLCRIEDVNKHCLEEFRKHWTCLDNNNQQLWQCRPAEWKLNKCVFDNLVSFLTFSELYSLPMFSRNSRKSFPTPLLAKHLYI